MFVWLNEMLSNASGFMPHGACYRWLPSILWLHIISDTIIALAYFSIPFALFFFVKKRTDMAYRWVFVLFGVFICLCGTTHLISIWTIWHPVYWLDGWIKLLTAVVSIITALLIWPLIPNLLRLPSPQALQISETYLRAIFNATPDAMLISNEQGIITMANQQASHLLGYSLDELLGQSIEHLVPGPLREKHVELRNQYSQVQHARSMGKGRTVKALRKNDEELFVEVNLSPIQTEQGLFFASALRDITERMQMEMCLRQSEERFRKMANSSAVMIWITDAQGEPTFVSQSWLDFTGFDSSQKMTHEDWLNLVHPDDKRSAFIDFYQDDQRQQAINTEYRLKAADGNWHWIIDRGMPLFDEQGTFTGYIGSAIDITERKLIQQNLQDKEQMLSESQRIAHIGSWSAQLTTGLVSWSNETYRIYGVNPTTFQPTMGTFLSLVHPEDRNFAKQWLNRCVAGNHPEELDYRILLPDGSVRFIRGSGDLYRDEENRPLRLVGSIQDITERKQAELALKNSEELLRAITDNASNVMFLKDLSGYYLHVNRRYEELFHLSNAEMQGKTDYEIFPKEVADVLVENDRRVVQVGYTLEIEECVPHDDGEHVYISVKFPVRDALGEIYAVCGVATDITERKSMEQDLRIAAAAFQSQEAMVITDVDGVIMRINKAFTESTGYSEVDSIGKKISLLKSGRHDQAFYQGMWDSVLSIGTWQGEIWDRRKNGEIYPKWLSITAVKDNSGITTHYIGIHTDITERKNAEGQIRQLAFYDALTGLPNRRLLEERLKHSIKLDRREGRQLGLMMLDLDRFKAINDSLGHLAGDELLQQVADRITSRLRDVDLVARLGGDEFIVLLEDITQSDDAARIAEEIINDLSKPFFLSQADNIRIGTSIGICLHPQHGDTPEQLIDHADIALYQAKAAGKGCFAYFSEAMTMAARERMDIETRLRQAIEHNELCVYFQPQIEILSGRIVGAEALVRWQDPRQGLIFPDQFIPIAEDTGLINEIGGWVLRETCKQGKGWLENGLPPITLAVNVSAHQFRRSNICSLVAEVLQETGFPAQSLELEITESGLMANQENAISVLDNLRALGVRLAIDDFGTGYSSLGYLKKFPLDVLKIDKSFIDDIPFRKSDMEIASTIVAMAHILGFKVLAEGVETPDQLAFLQAKGCDSYQGYFKSKPLPAEDFTLLLRNQQL